jgi:hypothetical protein
MRTRLRGIDQPCATISAKIFRYTSDMIFGARTTRRAQPDMIWSDFMK